MYTCPMLCLIHVAQLPLYCSIRWAASKRNPVRKRDIREDLSDRISMHVKFMSYKIDKVITEEVVRNIFSVYGDVCDTTIKQVSIDRVSTI